MEKNIQESFVGKTSKKRDTDIVPRKLELDEQSFFSLLRDYTNSLGITNVDKGVIIDNIIVQKEVKRYYKPETASVGSFAVSLVVSPYSYFWGKATEIPVFDLKFKVLFYPNKNEVRIGIYVNDYKADCCRKNGVSYEVIPRHFFRKSDGRFLDKVHDFFHRPEKFFELTKMGVDTDTLEICKNYIKLIADFEIEPEKGVGVLDLPNDSLEDAVTKVQSIFGTELFHLEENVLESFTKKISSKKNTDLISEPSFVLEDGVYILHETLGVKSVDGWNPKFNNGVIGILLIEDEHQIVIALEDSPVRHRWSKKYKLVNRPIDEWEDTKSDFNGEEYCRNLNSPDFPAAYYCLNYKKGGRNWYLPSSGELWMIYQHLEEIQNALSIVGGQKFATLNSLASYYWSSTETDAANACNLNLCYRYISFDNKIVQTNRVRPVSNFRKNTLKESFTKKISKKTKKDLQDDADELLLPKNYIELALMSVLCSAKKEGICFRKPKFHYKDDFGDVYELSEVFLQNDGQEIGTYAQRHYLEIEWNVYENGHMEEEPDSDVYPFKDEDNEIKTAIYKKVIEHLGLDYVRPQKKWLEFDDDGFDYFDN